MDVIFYMIVLSVVAVAVNIPLGVWRETLHKMSFLWFVAIHASIPLIVWLRHMWDIPLLFVPISIGWAVYGQMLGAGWMRKQQGQKPAKLQQAGKN